MNTGKTIFSQVMEFLPIYEFRKCVARYHGDYKVLSFSCMDQFLCMAFAQLTYRESLRDIESCLRFMQPKLYHMGIRGQVSRNTLANANNQRDWRIYADFSQVLIHQARGLYLEDSFGIDLENTVYALDSTTIDLCLSLFPWAHFRKNKGAIKLHTLLDLRGPIPSFIDITNGKFADVHILDILILEVDHFTSWIAAISTSRVYMPCIRRMPHSSPGPNPIHNTGAFIHVRSTKPRDCVAIKQFF